MVKKCGRLHFSPLFFGVGVLNALLFFSVTVHADFYIHGEVSDYFIRGQEGNRQSFCQVIVATLNKTNPTNRNLPCVSEAILNLPGVVDPPWKKYDLSQHEALAKEIIIISKIEMGKYHLKDKVSPDQWLKPADINMEWEILKSLGMELFVLRLPIYGNKVLVTLRYKNKVCGMPPQQRGENEYTIWLTSDLKRIANMPSSDFGMGKRGLLYRGRLYFVNLNRDDRLEIYRPSSLELRPDLGGFEKVCTIQFSDSTNSKGEIK